MNLSYESMTITNDGTIYVKWKELIVDADGNTHEKGIVRTSYNPSTTIDSIETEQVKTVARALWNDETIQNYKNNLPT